MAHLTWNSLVVELPLHVHLEGAIAASRTSGISTWERRLLQVGNIDLIDMNWFWHLDCESLRRIESILSLEREFTLELWPLIEVFYFVMIFDGMVVVNLGVLLHPEHDDFEREQTGLYPSMLCGELMDENEQ